MKLTREFEYNGAKVTVSRRTVRSQIQTELLYRAFGDDENTSDIELLEKAPFFQLLTQTEIDGDIGFKIPEVASSIKELKAGFDAFMDADGTFLDQLREAWLEVNAAVNVEILLPPDNVDKKKETPIETQEKTS